MATRRQGKRRGIGKWLLGMAIINILPLSALVWLGYALWSGQKTVDDLRRVFPVESGENFVNMGGALAALFLAGTLIVPLSHGAVKRIKAQLHKPGNKTLFDSILWLPRRILILFLGLIRTAGFALGLVALFLIIVFVVRMFAPDALSDVVDVKEWVAWVQRQI